jgi:hypothetical protein
VNKGRKTCFSRVLLIVELIMLRVDKNHLPFYFLFISKILVMFTFHVRYEPGIYYDPYMNRLLFENGISAQWHI